MMVDRPPGSPRALVDLVAARVPSRRPPRPVDVLLAALVTQLTSPPAEAVPAMRAAAAAFRASAASPAATPSWLEPVSLLAMDLLDDEALEAVSSRQVELARRQGALAVLPPALRFRAVAQSLQGHLEDAGASTAEAPAVDEAAGTVALALGELVVTAWRGDAGRFTALQAVMRTRAPALHSRRCAEIADVRDLVADLPSSSGASSPTVRGCGAPHARAASAAR